MQLTESLKTFIRMHAGDDLHRLTLSAGRYPGIDVPFATLQIAARRQIRDKLPAWYANDALIFPSRLAAEQCSSEQTARYKHQLLEGEQHLCDLTGGLGVDAYYFAQQVKHVTYVERDATCFDAAMHNFSVMQATNIEGRHADAAQTLAEIGAVDAFYLDPSRRGQNRHTRVFALSDCEPNVATLLPVLFTKAPKVALKLSPMLDVRHTLAALPETTEVHIVAVKNECKELLLVLRRNTCRIAALRIHCVHFATGNVAQTFRFTLADEQTCAPVIAEKVQAYLYEPNVAILKAGAYKQTAQTFGIEKLHTNSHLYTSDILSVDFPGRIFRVEDIIPFSAKNRKSIAQTIPQANISVRNFPLPVDELRRQTRIADGGEIYLFATMLHNEVKVLIRCQKI